MSAQVERLARTLPWLAAFTGLSYGIGYMVVGSFLALWGVREVEPIRIRYVLVGAVLLMLALAPALAGGGTLILADRALGDRPLRMRGLPALVVTVAAIIVLSALIATLEFVLFVANDSAIRETALWRDQWSVLYRGWLEWSVIAALSPAALARLAWQRRTGVLKLYAASKALVAVLATVAIGVWVLVAVPTYANSVYPSLPSWAGGGRPEVVRIELAEPLKQCEACSSNVLLVDEDSSRLIVLLGGPGAYRAVAVARDQVRAITYRP